MTSPRSAASQKLVIFESVKNFQLVRNHGNPVRELPKGPERAESENSKKLLQADLFLFCLPPRPLCLISTPQTARGVFLYALEGTACFISVLGVVHVCLAGCFLPIMPCLFDQYTFALREDFLYARKRGDLDIDEFRRVCLNRFLITVLVI